METNENALIEFIPIIKDLQSLRPWRLNGRQWITVFKESLTLPLIYLVIMLPFAFLLSWIFPVRGDEFFLFAIVDAIAVPANFLIHIFNSGCHVISPHSGSVYKLLFYISLFVAYGVVPIVAFFNFVFWIARFSKMPSTLSEKNDITETDTFDTSKREIKIFISSTFEDMHEERDMLVINVFPKLQELALRRKVNLIPIDLRWGITQREAESGMVIGKCFDGIRESSPFFIGLVGDRYGWIPSPNDFKTDPTLLDRHPWLKDKIDRGISMTQLEFLYGLTLERSLNEGRIFISKSIEGLALGKEGEFKRWVIDSGLFRHQFYLTAESIRPLVEDYVISILDKYYPIEFISDEDRILSEQDVYKFRYSRKYIPVDQRDTQLREFIDSDNDILFVYGPEGAGKRSSAVNVFEEMACIGKLKKPVYLFDFPDASPHDIQLKVAMLQKTETDLLVFYSTSGNSDLIARFIEIFRKILPLCRMVFLIKADNPVAFSETSAYRIQQLHWGKVGTEFRKRFFKEYFASYMKKVTDTQLDRLSTVCYADTPFVAKEIARQLIEFGHHELLDDKIQTLATLPDALSLFKNIIIESYNKVDSDDLKYIIKEVYENEGKPRKIIVEYMIKEEKDIVDNFIAFENRNGNIHFAHRLYRQAVHQLYYSASD